MPPPHLVLPDPAGGDPLDAVRRPADPATDDARWVLVGTGDAAAGVAAAAERALSGAAGVFGLAGLVLVDSDVASPPDVPTLRLAQPDDSAIATWWKAYAGRGPRLDPQLRDLLASDRVSTRTRAAHARRLLADDPDRAPRALDAAGLATLRRVTDLVVPQPGPAAEHLDPPDVEAYRSGLAALGPDPSDADLEALADEDSPLAAWFEDCRTDLVRAWLAHPASMARIGYDGFANGGDAPADQGFVDLTLGRREDWEPAALAEGGLR